MASMGPRFHERGNAAEVESLAAENRALQWGRAFTNAEIHPLRYGWPEDIESFNGAALSQTRKFDYEAVIQMY